MGARRSPLHFCLLLSAGPRHSPTIVSGAPWPLDAPRPLLETYDYIASLGGKWSMAFIHDIGGRMMLNSVWSARHINIDYKKTRQTTTGKKGKKTCRNNTNVGNCIASGWLSGVVIAPLAVINFSTYTAQHTHFATHNKYDKLNIRTLLFVNNNPSFILLPNKERTWRTVFRVYSVVVGVVNDEMPRCAAS